MFFLRVPLCALALVSQPRRPSPSLVLSAWMSVRVFGVCNTRGQLNLLPLITRIVQHPEKDTSYFQ